MPAGNTYEAIATATASGSTGTITFSSLPSTYTDIVLVISAGNTSSAPSIQIQFNGDTASNYSFLELGGSGSAAISDKGSNLTSSVIAYFGAPFTTLGNETVVSNIMNYSNSTTYKSYLTRANNAQFGVDALVGLWRSTAAITSFSLFNSNATNFMAGSTFTIYGIKAA
jgi:hypothetical protein